MYRDGLLGIPGSPEARRTFFELANFPHLGRAVRPGGVHRSTAEQENGLLLRGATADDIPILAWYDDEVHLLTHESFMSSPEYLRLDPSIQQEFATHWQFHRESFVAKQLQAQAQAIQAELMARDQLGIKNEQPDESQPASARA